MPPPNDFLVALAVFTNYLEPKSIEPNGQQRPLPKLMIILS